MSYLYFLLILITPGLNVLLLAMVYVPKSNIIRFFYILAIVLIAAIIYLYFMLYTYPVNYCDIWTYNFVLFTYMFVLVELFISSS
jgi:hypothetical protein